MVSLRHPENAPASPRTLQLFNVYQQYGGEENVVRDLSRRMAGPGWRDLFFHSRDWSQASPLTKLTQPLRTFYNPAALKQVDEAQAQFDADVWLMHNVLPVGSLGVYLRARRERVPIIQYLHNYRPFSMGGTAWAGGRIRAEGLQGNFWPEIRHGAYRGSRLQTLFMAFLYRLFFRLRLPHEIAAWISQSEFQKQRYVEAGIPEDRIHVQLPPRDPADEPETWRDEDYLLYLGRLEPEKGPTLLLDLWEQHPELPKLVIAGTGSLQQEIDTRAHHLRHLTYVGEVKGEAKRDLLQGCSALIAPSQWWEVLGLVAFEAYAQEKPVLATRTGGLGEIVVDGETGFQFETGSTKGILEAVQRLQSISPKERRAMGARGRLWTNERTRPDHWQETYQSLARDAIERRTKTLS